MKKAKLVLELMIISLLFTLAANAQCPVPAGLSTTSLSPSSTQLDWTAVPGATSYKLEVQNGQNNPVFFRITPSASTNTYTVTGLTPGSIYKFKVRTVCSGGDKSNWSAWSTFAAGGGTINCNQPTGLLVTGSTGTTASFTWNASAGGLGYAVRVEDASGNPVDFLFNANTTSNTYTVAGLNPSSNYKVKVRKRCAPGITGPWTAWTFFTTPVLRVAGSQQYSGIYPNPASNELNVMISGNTSDTPSEIALFDMSGRQVYHDEIRNISETMHYRIPVADLPEGLYLVRFQSSGNVVTERVSVVR
jgi:hypothetical protein